MKYEIIRKIGDGGEGRVYLVRDRILDKTWAMKVIPWVGEEGHMKRDLPFPIRIMKNFDHPLLPRLVDLFIRPPFLCLVMDYIPGRNLEDLVREEGPRDREEVLAWAKDLLSILIYFHSRVPPIYYQDLKPANILLTKEGGIKLIDFGAIFSPQGQENEGDQGQKNKGSLGYAGPELYGGGEVGPWTDIYSLGMTLSFLLTGKDPGEVDFKLLSKANNSSSSDTCSGRLEKAICRATKPLPRDRYPSCRAMVKDLEGGERKKSGRRGSLVRGMVFLLSLCLLYLLAQASYQNDRYRAKVRESIEGEDETVFEAIKMKPDRPEAYRVLYHHYQKDKRLSDEEIQILDSLAFPLKREKYKEDWSLFFFDLGTFYLEEGIRRVKKGELTPMACRAGDYFSLCLEALEKKDDMADRVRFRLAICHLHQKYLMRRPGVEKKTKEDWVEGMKDIRFGIDHWKEMEDIDRALFADAGFWTLQALIEESDNIGLVDEAIHLQEDLACLLKKMSLKGDLDILQERVLNFQEERRSD